MTDKRLDPLHEEHKKLCKSKIKPKKLTVAVPVSAMRAKPKKDAMRISELLYGETATAYAENDDFYLLQSSHDNYVGYGKKSDFISYRNVSTSLQVQVKASPVFSKADIKSPIIAQLSGGSYISPKSEQSNYYQIQIRSHGKNRKAYLHKSHIANSKKQKVSADSLISTGRRFLGLPYIWGGRSFRGLDCSGLVQMVLMLHGIACPRDSDMQASTIGKSVATMQKGDILFWRGHVGFYTGSHLLHAYGGTCLVQEDAAHDIFPRLTEACDADICAIRRLI